MRNRIKEPRVSGFPILKSLLMPLLLGLSASLSGAVPPPAPGLSPAQDWKLPLFTKEGFRSMSLRGDRVYPLGPDRIDVENIEITVFSGDKSQQVKSILLSAKASYLPKEQRASGPGAVRLIRDDGEISGEDWTYEKNGEKVSIRRNARIVLNMNIGDMLK